MTSPVSRRDFLRFSAAAAAALLPGRAFAASPAGTPLHGLSAFGDLKYPLRFAHFGYVNPDAPKGGTFAFGPPNWQTNQNVLTFNTLNAMTLKGDAPPRTELTFDSLMMRALDEPDALYGLLAESVTLSADRNSFDFLLREEARFHDGTPVTAQDVAFTYRLFKEKGHPALALPLAHLVSAEALDGRTVRLAFNGSQAARTVLTVVEYPIVSQAWFETHDFEGGGLEAPLGSGPYRIGRFSAGVHIEYDKVPDYWGADLAVNRGQNNFERIRIDFYRERRAGFEAFKKGEVAMREEFTASMWATGYDFPALAAGRVVKGEFPAEKRPSMQAVALNQRRERFRDVRVRRAIALCFDFEWTNRNLFYGLYERSQSCFEKSDYKAEGLPSPEELALLEPHRENLPPEVFGEAAMQPASNGSGRDRALFSQAAKLLAEAGWKRQGNALANDKGERLSLEFMADDQALLRIVQPWTDNMRAIGIDASVRVVDSAQYAARQMSFDFDMVMFASSFTATPTRDELENLFHSRTAALSGTRNLPGTADETVDALIDTAGAARDRGELAVALRALDRVLRARLDWIPNWYAPNHRVAYWDMFGMPAEKPDYGFPVETIWWLDEGKAKAIGKA